MAIDTGIAPNTLSGQLGEVIFYTANGQSLVRSRARHINKSNSTNAILTRDKFRVAMNFNKLMQFYLPTIYPVKTPPKNNFSTNVGVFYKMINNFLYFDESITKNFTFGNGATSGPIITQITNNFAGHIQLSWDHGQPPAGWNPNNTTINVLVFNRELTTFLYINKQQPFLNGVTDFNVRPQFQNGDDIFIFAQAYTLDFQPFLTSVCTSIVPLQTYSA